MSQTFLKRLAHLLLGISLAGLVIWLFYFDSHNLLDRWTWQQEYEELQERNKQLQEDIEQLQIQLDEPPADSLIERIAREEYGMSKPGEIIYRLPPSKE